MVAFKRRWIRYERSETPGAGLMWVMVILNLLAGIGVFLHELGVKFH